RFFRNLLEELVQPLLTFHLSRQQLIVRTALEPVCDDPCKSRLTGTCWSGKQDLEPVVVRQCADVDVDPLLRYLLTTIRNTSFVVPETIRLPTIKSEHERQKR